MRTIIDRIKITGLHATKNIEASMQDNTLILVGENGSGKTTFLRILFHFLSCRWLLLSQFSFHTVSVTINGTDHSVTHDQVRKVFDRNFDQRFLKHFPPSARRHIIELIEGGKADRVPIEIERISSRYDIPREILFQQIEQFFLNQEKPATKQLQELESRIHRAINAQILYLPTYRRIERELAAIFEGVDPDDLRRQRVRYRHMETDQSYIELVEFGMRDVQRAVEGALVALKEFARENLNSLTLRYLGDVVNREYENINMSDIAGASEETVHAVLDRIQESILTRDHKDHIFDVINSARSADAPQEHEKIICHYFLKLLSFQGSLRDKERPISEFCDLCSQYIVDKKFVYDSSTFGFSIEPRDNLPTSNKIELCDLSSGEKQIVSLFSHLYLSGKNRYLVLIDEPELSLSVPWQRRFLVDIRNGEFCTGLIATTHSPFIYENDLRPYAHSLGEFTSA